jgi:hypothetical protein
MPTTTPSPHQDPAFPTRHPSDVSLLEHVTTLMAAMDRRYESQLEDLKESVTRRFTDTNQSFGSLHEDLKTAVVQRFADADLRYQQRFDAQTNALDAALAAAKEAVQTALVAAEKATTKAEVAADKRFEGVNEFRAQLADQAATLMPRVEAEQRISALAEKISDLKSTMDTSTGQAAGTQLDRQLQEIRTLATANSTQLSVATGKTGGLQAGWVYLLGGLGALGTIASIMVILVSSR